jgi:hypothetical protein
MANSSAIISDCRVESDKEYRDKEYRDKSTEIRVPR